MTTKPPKTIQLDFITLSIYPNYLISTIKEGVLFDIPQLTILEQLFDAYYPDQEFVIIADRKHDYTVNPTCYLEVSKYEKLQGIAVVCYSEASEQTAAFEENFYKKPFEVFNDLDNAKEWSLQLLQGSV
ncbi:hypothetical protein [Altibacter sp. HG106]|uniref:hypothetical protein n=1 Tax=Altibacter sp. HG106 TaxID=3023937 RepID=UPI0023501EF4|nr:hypothetical protein [Altibacter sp. HG106]MDC7996221.1 hypothetical protein [Altibacter sp. HG106]